MEKMILYRIRIKQGFQIMRLMLITIILTYFIGCGFYYIANLPLNTKDYPNFIAYLDYVKGEDPEWMKSQDV